MGGEGQDAADEAATQLNDEIAGQESGERPDAVETGDAKKPE